MKNKLLNYILLVIIVGSLSYAVFLPFLGFYWDDWPSMWVYHSMGKAGIIEFMSIDRPVVGWLHQFLLSILGTSPLQWQFFSLAVRMIGVILVGICLFNLWPKRRFEICCFSLFYLVYPAFLQQPTSFVFSFASVHLILYIFSWLLMILALKKNKYNMLYYCVSLGGLACLFISEYTVGFELLIRPLVLWYLIKGDSESGTKKRMKVIRFLSPYFILTMIYLVWRLFLYTPAKVLYNQRSIFVKILQNPVQEVFGRIKMAVSDIIETSIMSWMQPLFRFDIHDLFNFKDRATYVEWFVIASTFLVVFFFLRRCLWSVKNQPNTESDSSRWYIYFILVGIILVVAGGLPLWYANFDYNSNFLVDDAETDRFTGSMSLGASFVGVGLLLLFIKKDIQRVLLISIIVSLAAGLHFANANQHRRDWMRQKDILWQLYWRAPNLQPGTTVLMNRGDLLHPRYYVMTSQLMFTYAPDHSTKHLPFWACLVDFGVKNRIKRYTKGRPINGYIRTLMFEGSTDACISLWIPPIGSIRILDPVRDEVPSISAEARLARTISNLDRIQTLPTTTNGPPKSIFGIESDYSWSYYFQKADLARQYDDWIRVIQLYEEACQKRLEPLNLSELFVFLEAHVVMGYKSESMELVEDLLADRTMYSAMTSFVHRMEDVHSSNKRQRIILEKIKEKMK